MTKNVGDRERNQVLNQPHRRGDTSQLRESEFGSFVLRYRLRQECYDAGIEYLAVTRRYRSAIQAPRVSALREPSGFSGEEDHEKVRKWDAKIKEIELAMKCAGLPAFEAARSLILDDKSVPEHLVAPVKRVLLQLAIACGAMA